MSLYCSVGSTETNLSERQLKELLVDSLATLGKRTSVLAVPPDQSREHSRAGVLTRFAWEHYGEGLKAVLPAIGTHTPMRPDQIEHMFGKMPLELFRVHNWRTDVETLGELPAAFIREQSEGKLNYTWPAQVNKLISQGGFDLILSIGQVVPHEVIGMANHSKNILIGSGGREGINRSHYLGAVYGMERIMGRAENPVRNVLNRASEKFLKHLPIVYVQTVVGRGNDGGLAVRGLFIGDDLECFLKAAELSLKVNFEMLDEPIKKAVVYLDPKEFHSTWIGNKAVYRTRMALADGAELIILAPGVKEFGEDKGIDALIRKYGYRGTPATLKAVEENADLAADLSAAAHLIHASSEGRFTIRWCPGGLSRKEIEGAGFEYGDLNAMTSKYDPEKLRHGWNDVGGERIFFVANPGLGLWAHRSRFESSNAPVWRITTRDEPRNCSMGGRITFMGTAGLKLNKYSVGTGDRFAHQAKAQLQACVKALERGIEVIPVWNKSNREHIIIGSDPASVRQAADAAVKALGWNLPYFCDADHITAATVGRFLAPCDFFTFDVADFIGQPAQAADIEKFVKRHPELEGSIELAGADEAFEITPEILRLTAVKFLAAVKQAGEVYRRVLSARGAGNFIPEVSMDETDRAQSPVELLIILAAIADEGIPVQTIAPKFSGRFNKGVDYVGDVAQFEREMALDMAAIAYAVKQYGLPENLKLSVHSGSDKFSIYPAIHATMQRMNAGVHLKTAGTTWLEELIGLAEAGGEGLTLAREVYAEALAHREELCAPYSTVIDIDTRKLPSAEDVRRWSSEQYTSALRHLECSPAYNSSLRQLLHVGFKVAAKMKGRYLALLEANEAVIAKNVTENLFDRHIAPVFLGISS